VVAVEVPAAAAAASTTSAGAGFVGLKVPGLDSIKALACCEDAYLPIKEEVVELRLSTVGSLRKRIVGIRK